MSLLFLMLLLCLQQNSMCFFNRTNELEVLIKRIPFAHNMTETFKLFVSINVNKTSNSQIRHAKENYIGFNNHFYKSVNYSSEVAKLLFKLINMNKSESVENNYVTMPNTSLLEMIRNIVEAEKKNHMLSRRQLNIAGTIASAVEKTLATILSQSTGDMVKKYFPQFGGTANVLSVVSDLVNTYAKARNYSIALRQMYGNIVGPVLNSIVPDMKNVTLVLKYHAATGWQKVPILGGVFTLLKAFPNVSTLTSQRVIKRVDQLRKYSHAIRGFVSKIVSRLNSVPVALKYYTQLIKYSFQYLTGIFEWMHVSKQTIANRFLGLFRIRNKLLNLFSSETKSRQSKNNPKRSNTSNAVLDAMKIFLKLAPQILHIFPSPFCMMPDAVDSLINGTIMSPLLNITPFLSTIITNLTDNNWRVDSLINFMIDFIANNRSRNLMDLLPFNLNNSLIAVTNMILSNTLNLTGLDLPSSMRTIPSRIFTRLTDPFHLRTHRKEISRFKIMRAYLKRLRGKILKRFSRKKNSLLKMFQVKRNSETIAPLEYIIDRLRNYLGYYISRIGFVDYFLNLFGLSSKKQSERVQSTSYSEKKSPKNTSASKNNHFNFKPPKFAVNPIDPSVRHLSLFNWFTTPGKGGKSSLFNFNNKNYVSLVNLFSGGHKNKKDDRCTNKYPWLNCYPCKTDSTNGTVLCCPLNNRIAGTEGISAINMANKASIMYTKHPPKAGLMNNNKTAVDTAYNSTNKDTKTSVKASSTTPKNTECDSEISTKSTTSASEVKSSSVVTTVPHEIEEDILLSEIEEDMGDSYNNNNNNLTNSVNDPPVEEFDIFY